MGSHQRQVMEARRRAAGLVREVGDEVRRARVTAGMSQAQVAALLGWSRQRLARIESGRSIRAAAADLAVLSVAVGLRLQLRAFPAGPPLRDVAQLAVTGRLRRILSPAWRLALEVPVRIGGDLRAFDLVLREPRSSATVCVEIITRLADAQAQLRAIHLKWRDGAPPGARLVVVLADTPANRRALAAVRELLRDELPLDSRAVLAAVRDGHDPGANGVVLV
jgi:transcriptional regulator with XRE-family HTH domain